MSILKNNALLVDGSTLEEEFHGVGFVEVEVKAWVKAVDAVDIVLAVFSLRTSFVQGWLRDVDVALVEVLSVAEEASESGWAVAHIIICVFLFASYSALVVWKSCEMFISLVSRTIGDVRSGILVAVVVDLGELLGLGSVFAAAIGRSFDWISLYNSKQFNIRHDIRIHVFVIDSLVSWLGLRGWLGWLRSSICCHRCGIGLSGTGRI